MDGPEALQPLPYDPGAAQAALADLEALQRLLRAVQWRRGQLARAALLDWRGPARDDFERLDRQVAALHAALEEELDRLRRRVRAELAEVEAENRRRARMVLARGQERDRILARTASGTSLTGRWR